MNGKRTRKDTPIKGEYERYRLKNINQMLKKREEYEIKQLQNNKAKEGKDMATTKMVKVEKEDEIYYIQSKEQIDEYELARAIEWLLTIMYMKIEWTDLKMLLINTRD